MAEYRTPKVLLGVSEDGSQWFGPAEPISAPIIEITDTEYVYHLPDPPVVPNADAAE